MQTTWPWWQIANRSYRIHWRSGTGYFTGHGLNIDVEKTEVLHIGLQREELDIELEGKKLTQGDSFVYLGGAVCGDGKTEREVRRKEYRLVRSRGKQLRE